MSDEKVEEAVPVRVSMSTGETKPKKAPAEEPRNQYGQTEAEVEALRQELHRMWSSEPL